MQKIIHHLIRLALLLVILASCKKEGYQIFVKEASSPANALTASSTNIILSKATENTNAVTFSWNAADFNKESIVSYTLQLALAADTSGTNAWKNAKVFNAGNNLLSYSFITKDLNSLLTNMALPAGIAAKIAVRLKSDVNQYNGSVSAVSSAYSGSVVLDITPYSLSLYIPGAYQGWNPSAAPLLNPADGRPGLYEAYVYMPDKGLQYFKYTNAPDWDHTNYGDGGNGSFSTDGQAGGLNVPDSGYYELTADMNTNKWTATRTSWGIIGDATPGGWDNDTQLAYDVANQVWKVTANMKHNGSFKFRANKEWVIDFGIDNNGNLVYADNPFFGYAANLDNLSVAEDGNYTITLDLHISGKYSYSLVKN
ncbi:MAG: SusE domain-containing protein [Ferruginibacter sp.]